MRTDPTTHKRNNTQTRPTDPERAIRAVGVPKDTLFGTRTSLHQKVKKLSQKH